jgi:hypothetical protein
MRQDDDDDVSIHEAILQANQVTDRELLWHRIGPLIVSVIIMALVWIFLVGRKEVSPTTEMVWPATAVLDKGIHHNLDLTTLSKDLHFSVVAPDLRQLGLKLAKSSTASFGGVTAAVMQCQYGKSVVLLYRFRQPSKLFKDMKQFRGKNSIFYYTSSDAVAVVAWRDHVFGYYGLAAKATEKDLLTLADKIVKELK